MKERERKVYETPCVELLSARVEKGFAGSFSSNSTINSLGEGETINGDLLFS